VLNLRGATPDRPTHVMRIIIRKPPIRRTNDPINPSDDQERPTNHHEPQRSRRFSFLARSGDDVPEYDESRHDRDEE
jgi:hypothetical protein